MFNEHCVYYYIGYEPAGLTVHLPLKTIEDDFIFLAWVSIGYEPAGLTMHPPP